MATAKCSTRAVWVVDGPAPLEAGREPRHGETANKEDHRGENVALPCETEPRLVAECQVYDAEQVGNPDDGDERGILEQVDHGIDDGGKNGPQGLRQNNETLYLPVAQAQRVRGLGLAARDALKAAPDDLGHIGGGK